MNEWKKKKTVASRSQISPPDQQTAMQSWETPEALRLPHLPALQSERDEAGRAQPGGLFGRAGPGRGRLCGLHAFPEESACHRPSHSVQSLSPDHPAKQSVCFEGIILFKG